MTVTEALGPAPSVSVSDKIYAARLHAVRARPYMATALYALHLIESPLVPTMSVDRYWRCYLSPAFVASRPEEEIAALLVHEVSHLLRDHAARSDRYAEDHGFDSPAERLRMNIAADFEINDDVYGSGLVTPDDAVHPSALDLDTGLLMEDYLRWFSLGPRTEAMAWLECGSGGDGRHREWERGPEGADGLSGQERDAVRFAVATAISDRAGDVPAGWRRWAHDAVHPPQPWQALLGAAIRAAVSTSGVGDDYTFGRPARRSVALPGVIVPSLRRTPPKVSVVIDTSGSVSDAELGSALLEVAAIARALSGRRDLLTVVSCDAAAHVAQPICRAESIPLHGGGGTDLRSGFDAALRTRPDVVVALTDGHTPWPSHRPACRTIVGLFAREYRAYAPLNASPVAAYAGGTYSGGGSAPPDWAQVVRIGEPGR
ncbi:VWA-like domain-containing protein [Gordonia McavH-238-E]|uniref:vWA domain-containing protein n=1 Tax=Gordonia sp. McavH-238-E TaxID=2917736 RepID=UPI001EF53BD0|nr:VWA-like domain-containing protein [Gordonia sp. McavH-238-E]MCG7633855.1 VWA-like domain-containing protein [Gordonia sp. McavH-238-E]